MKHVIKIMPDSTIKLPEYIMMELNVIPGNEIVLDLTDMLTNDLNKDSYTAVTISNLDDYEHEEEFRDEKTQ